MALFKIEHWDKGKPEKKSKDEVHGNHPKEIENMYDKLGKEIKIIEKVEINQNDILKRIPEDGPDEFGNLFKDSFPPINTGQPMPQTKQPMSPETVFKDGDNEYKVVNGKVYKRVWIDVKDKTLRIVDEKIQKLDWKPMGK